MVSIQLAFAFLLFFVPGYLATYLMPWVRGIASRIAFSLVTSISLGVILSFVIVLLGLPLFPVFPVALILLIGVESFVLRARFKEVVSGGTGVSNREWVTVVFSFLFSLLAALFIFIPHLNHAWPIHADEWWMIGTVENIGEGRGLNAHPYTFSPFMNDKPGFSSYAAGMLGLAGADPIRAWPYLPALTLFLVSFISSLLVFRFTGDRWAAWCLPFFLAALRSNIFMLGWWFFVPSMFSFVFIVPLLISLSDWKETARGKLWALLLFIALSLVYVPYAAVVGIALLLAMRGAITGAKRVYRWVLAFGIGAAVAIGTSLSPYREYWNMPGVPHLYEPIADYLKAFFVPIQATVSDAGIFLNLLDIAGIFLLLCAAFGFLFFRKEKWISALLWGVFVCGLNLISVWSFHASFMMFHQRAFYLFAVLAALFAAIGAARLFGWIARTPFFRNLGEWRILCIGVLAAELLFLLFSGYFILPKGTYPFALVDEENLTAMQWLRGRDDLKGMKTVSNTIQGSIMTPLTRLVAKVNLLTTQTVSASINMKEFNVLNEGTCAEKESFITKMDADIVYAPIPQECPFLEKIYGTPNVFIYLVRGDKERYDGDDTGQ